MTQSQSELLATIREALNLADSYAYRGSYSASVYERATEALNRLCEMQKGEVGEEQLAIVVAKALRDEKFKWRYTKDEMTAVGLYLDDAETAIKALKPYLRQPAEPVDVEGLIAKLEKEIVEPTTAPLSVITMGMNIGLETAVSIIRQHFGQQIKEEDHD